MPLEDVKKVGGREITGASSRLQCGSLEMHIIDNTTPPRL